MFAASTNHRVRPYRGALDVREAMIGADERPSKPSLRRRLFFLRPLPAYKELAKMALLLAFVSVALGIEGIEAFWRYFPACGSI
jgi:hypothetical protein